MDIFSAIQKRHSTRKYSDKEVDFHDIAVILEAARLAPSSGNLQAWKFIVVRDKNKRHAIAEACQKQYWMADAPVHIVVVSETEKVEQFYGIRGDRLYSIQNCAAAIQSMLLAATSLGLGTCWVGYFDENEICALAGIPARSRVQAIITLGFEEGKHESPDKVPLYTITYFEKYGNRIANPHKSMNDWADVWQDYLDKGKDKGKLHVIKIKEKIKKIQAKLKRHIEKLKKK